MSWVEPVSPITVDARGLLCPLPVIRLAQAARDAPPGAQITLLASDPAARHDVPAWCRMRGHELCEMTEMTAPDELAGSAGTDPVTTPEAHTHLRFVVRVQAQPPKAAGRGS